MRRDDRRISCYFRELPSCLDLPGEEEMIFDELMSHPDLVPTGVSVEDYRRYFVDYADAPGASSGDDSDDELPGRDGDEKDMALLETADSLLCEWNFFCAASLPPSHMKYALHVGCGCAKLAGHLADAAELNNDGEKALKRCLWKRSLKDINDLLGALLDAGSPVAGSAEAVRAAETLQCLRERVIARLA